MIELPRPMFLLVCPRVHCALSNAKGYGSLDAKDSKVIGRVSCRRSSFVYSERLTSHSSPDSFQSCGKKCVYNLCVRSTRVLSSPGSLDTSSHRRYNDADG